MRAQINSWPDPQDALEGSDCTAVPLLTLRQKVGLLCSIPVRPWLLPQSPRGRLEEERGSMNHSAICEHNSSYIHSSWRMHGGIKSLYYSVRHLTYIIFLLF